MSKPPVRRRAVDPSQPEPTATPAPPRADAAPPAPRQAPPAPRERGRQRRLSPHDGDERPTAPVTPDRAPVSSRLSELEAIARLDSVDMAALLGAAPTRTRLPEPGERMRGRVSGVGADELQVDLGLRVEGWLARRELPDATVGAEVDVFVVWADDTGVHLSRRLSGEAAEALLEDAAASGIPVEGTVKSRNRGGYEVVVGGQRCFCPISQISRLPLADPDAVLGQELAFRVLETGDKIVLSRRALEEAEIEEERARFLSTVAEGQVHEATVLRALGWGAFLDVHGAEARLPRREFSWEEVDDLSAHLTAGQTLRVRVIDVDAEGRITVSRRDPSLDPWATVTERISPNAVVTGRVVSQTEFGVFVELQPGLQGLLHASRLPGRKPDPGSVLEVRVLSIDPERRRIELAPSSFDPEAQAAHGVGTEVQGEVTEVTDRGVRVLLADGRTAWLPAREAELEPGTVLAQRFRVGHPATGRVLSVDGDRVVLTQKADDTTERDAWRAHARAEGGRGAMGTLGDLLKGFGR